MNSYNKNEDKSGIPSTKKMLVMKSSCLIYLNLISGDLVGIKISKPNWWDKQWAKKINNFSWRVKQEALSESLRKGKTWRIAYLLSQDKENKKLGNSNNLLNLNGLINWGDSTGYWGVLAKAIHSNQPESTALLLVAGANVKKTPDKETHKRPVHLAITRNDGYLFTILCKSGAEVYYKDLSYATSNSMKKLVKTELGKTKHSASITNVLWEKMNDTTISKTIQNSTTRIQTIFNFQAARMTHIHEILSKKDKMVVHHHAPIIEYFNEAQYTKEIEDAKKQLSYMGGKPDYKPRNKNYITKRIINRKK